MKISLVWGVARGMIWGRSAALELRGAALLVSFSIVLASRRQAEGSVPYQSWLLVQVGECVRELVPQHAGPSRQGGVVVCEA